MKNDYRIDERRRLGLNRIEYQVFEKMYNELKAESDKLIDAERPKVRLRKMYVHDLYNTNYEGLNEEEIREIRKRKDLIDWIKDPDFALKEIIE